MYCNKTNLWCTFGKMEYHSEQGDWSLVTSLVDSGDTGSRGSGRQAGGRVALTSTEPTCLPGKYWHAAAAHTELLVTLACSLRQLSPFPGTQVSAVSLPTISIPCPRKQASLMFNTARTYPSSSKDSSVSKENKKKPSENLITFGFKCSGAM